MKTLLYGVLFCTLFSSCAYYNTFYNTKRLYNEAKKEREKRRDDKLTAAEKRKYDETIEKASKILEVYPNSKYVDHALLIIGECMYYKEQYIPAQRKFQELITFFPKSSRINQAKLWLAKTQVQLKDFAQARVILSELLAKKDVKDDIVSQGRYVLGEILYDQKDYAGAEIEFLAASQVGKDKEMRWMAFFRLGQCQLLLGKNEEAAKHFEVAIHNSIKVKQGFDARLHYARALKQAGNFKDATRICIELLANEQFKSDFGHVHLEVADIVYREGKALYGNAEDSQMQLQGKIKEALEKYEIVLLQNKRTPVAAEAHYRIGQILEKDLFDFAGAQESFQKVKAEFRASPFADEAEQRAKDIADLIRLNNLVKIAQGQEVMTAGTVFRKLTELEYLLLEHGVHPELRFMREQERLGKLQTAQTQAEEAEAAAAGSKEDQLIENKLQLAEVYLFQFGQVDSAVSEYRQVNDLHAEHPGAARALFSLAYIEENIHKNKFKTDSLLYDLIQRFPKSEQAEAAQIKLGLGEKTREPAAILFERAGETLFSKHDAESAIDGYRSLAQAYPETDFAPRALYAIGWIHEALRFDNDRAAKVYTEVLEKYPDFEKQAVLRDKLLALEKQDTDEKSAAVAAESKKQESSKVEEKEEIERKAEHSAIQPTDGAPMVTRDRRPRIRQQSNRGVAR